MDVVERRVRWPWHASGGAGAASLLLGAVVLAGWWNAIVSIIRPVPGLPGMVPNTASWFVLLGICLLIVRRRRIGGILRWLARVLALVVVLLAGATLTEYLFDRDLGIDQRLINVFMNVGTGFPPGRSAPGTAAAFLMLGWALLTVDVRPAVRRHLVDVLASGAALIALLATAGYIYGATALYATEFPNTGMAPHTAIGVLILSAGVICVRPHRGLITLLSSAGAGGFMVRRLLSGALAIPVLGALVMLGFGTSLYGQPFAAALLAVASTAIAVGLVLFTGRTVDRIDALRRASGQALAEREERLRDLINQASDGIFIANLEGHYTEVNDAGCKMLNYRREDLLGKTIMDLLPETDIPRLEASKATMLRGVTQVDEWMLKRGDGTFVPVEVSAKILPDGRWQGLVRDISARKQMESASVAVAEAMAVAPQSSVHAVLHTIALQAQLVADAEYVAIGLGGSADRPFDPWVFVGLSPETASRIGKPPRATGLLGWVATHDEIVRLPDIRRHLGFRGVPSNHPQLTSFLGVPVRSRGKAIGNLYLANKRGGGEFTSDDERNVARLAARAAIVIETARLYQAEGLERSWLEAMIDQIPEGIVLADATDAHHIENRSMQAFARVTGEHDPQGRSVRYDLRLPTGEPVPVADQPQVRALSNGITTLRQEFALLDKEGRLVPVLVSAAPTLDAQGRASAMVAIYQDISTRKELERLREEWTTVVAHDLRQPLAIIVLEADTLATMIDPGRVEERKLVEHVRRAASRLNRMINDLLDVSLLDARRLALDPAETDLAALLAEAAERIADLAPGHSVRLRLGIRRAPVFIDASRIEQVLHNLVSNAAKYGDPGGEITIDLAQSDGQFEVSVIGRGQGIQPTALKTLFQRFTRTESARARGIPGLGLGLYICKGLVEAHGGRIWATSVPGATTTFSFTIPKVAGAEPRPATERDVDEVHVSRQR